MQRKFLCWDNPRDAIVTLILILMVVGCINVFSASFVGAKDMFDDSYYYLKRYLMFGGLGIAVMLFLGWRAPSYKVWLGKNWQNLIYWGIVAMLAAVEAIGVINNGAQRWLHIGGLSIQPSEFAKLAIIMVAASKLGKILKRRMTPQLLGFSTGQVFLQAALYAVLVFAQPDMGTATIIVALVILMYILAGLPWRTVGGIMLLGGAGAVYLAIAEPYRLDRLKVWFDPFSDASNNGYQMVQSLLSIGSGGLVGLPWGQGSGKFFYLPEAHTDFAFAIFCQEWGLLGAVLLIGIFILLAAALLRVAVSTKDEQGYLLVAGASFLTVGQAAVNMAMVCGLLPVIGVPLPFISYGGTSMVITLASIGLVLSVYKEECKREQLEKMQPEERRTQMRVILKDKDNGRWRRE